jgi:two-component system chemotaxis response regulator CheB
VKQAVRVVVVDDSEVMREAIASLLSEDPGIVVIGRGKDGVEAVELAKALRPDVVTMDVLMPRLDGLEATTQIMAEAPSRILVVCSVDDTSDVDLSFRAMAAGALELIAKPRGQALRTWGATIRDSVRLMAEVPVVRRWRATTGERSAVPVAHRARVSALGIAASTGGPPALAELLGQLPADLRVPVLVAQHMAPGFVSGLVRWLTRVSPLEVVVAANGMFCRPGQVFLAPDGQDIEVDREGVLRVLPVSGPHFPSANRLLTSMAAAYGSRSAGLVMTGMGDDGTAGLRAICDAGGVTFAQDEASSVVFGMPRAAIDAGVAKHVVALSALPGVIRELCGTVGAARIPSRFD